MLPFKRKHNKKSIVKNGLVLWLDGRDFKNSPSTTIWGDRSGQNNNATPSNFAYTTSSGSDGQGGVIFDQVDDYCTILNSSSFDFQGNDFTIAFTISIAAFNSVANTVMCKRYSVNSSNSFDIRFNTSNGIVFYYTIDGATLKGMTFQYSFAVNTKYRICFRRIGNLLALYVNGFYVDSQIIGTNSIFTSTSDIIIGALNSGGAKTYFLNGTLKNLVVNKGHGYTDSEISRDYRATR